MQCTKDDLFNNFILNMKEEGVKKSRISTRIEQKINDYININYNKADFEDKLVKFAFIMIKQCKEKSLSTPCEKCGRPLKSFNKQWKDWSNRTMHKTCFLNKY